MACLDKDPAKRPQTALELIQRLKRLDGPVTLSGSMRVPEEMVTGDNPVAGRARRRLMVTVLIGLVAALALAAFWFNQPLRKARRLIDAGRGPEALQVIDDSGDVDKSASLKMLKAAALNQTGRHDEAWKLLEQVPESVELEGEALEALCDGYGRNESPRLRKLLARLPKVKTLPSLQRLAKGDPSWPQWGALRFVDSEYAGQGLPLAKLYETALERKDCSQRRIAAKRLGDLRAVEAIDALKRLKAQPRKRGFLSDDECGQDAAAQALNRLEKEE